MIQLRLIINAKVYDYLYLLIERAYINCNLLCEKGSCEIYLVCLVHGVYCFEMLAVHMAHFLAMRRMCTS